MCMHEFKGYFSIILGPKENRSRVSEYLPDRPKTSTWGERNDVWARNGVGRIEDSAHLTGVTILEKNEFNRSAMFEATLVWHWLLKLILPFHSTLIYHIAFIVGTKWACNFFIRYEFLARPKKERNYFLRIWLMTKEKNLNKEEQREREKTLKSDPELLPT